MKRTHIAASLVILALLAGVALMNRCSGGDMARVTISFHSEEITRSGIMKSFIGKALSLFSTPVYAKSPITKDDVTAIHLSVSGPDMEEINVDIPPTADEYTLMVPPGESRVFTVSAYGPDPYYSSGTQLLLEGSNSINLEAGDYASVVITMVQVWF